MSSAAASSGQQIVLEEEFDENYEPTDEEVVEYARFLGMDEEKDKHLFWIARESLKAPLPKDWKPCQSDDGNIYYFNFSTGESIWDHPCDEHYRQLYEREKKKHLSGGQPNQKSEDKKERDSRDSSKSPRPQNTQLKQPSSKPETSSYAAAASAGSNAPSALKPLPSVIPSKSLTPLQPLSSLKPASETPPSSTLSTPLKSLSSDKPSFLQGSSLVAGIASKSSNPKVPSSLSHEILSDKAQLKKKDEIMEMDVDDDDEDDDDDDNFFTPIKASSTAKKEPAAAMAATAATAATATAIISKSDKLQSSTSSQSELELNANSKRTTSVIDSSKPTPISNTKPINASNAFGADTDSQSEIAMSSKNHRSAAVVETKVESIKHFDSDESVSEDPVSPFTKPVVAGITGGVKNDGDPISRALNRLESENDSDESSKSSSDNRHAPKKSGKLPVAAATKETKKHSLNMFDEDDDEEDVSDFDDDDDPLSELLPGLGGGQSHATKKPPAKKADEISQTSEVSSIEPFSKKMDVKATNLTSPPERPPSSTKPDRSSSKSPTPITHSSLTSLNQINTTNLNATPSLTKIGSTSSVQVISPKANQLLGLEEKKPSVQGLNTVSASNASLKARQVLGLPGSGASSPKSTKKGGFNQDPMASSSSSALSSPVSAPKSFNTGSTKIKKEGSSSPSHNDDDDEDNDDDDEDDTDSKSRHDNTDSAVSPKVKQVLGLPEETHRVGVQGLNAVSASNASLKARQVLGLPTTTATATSMTSSAVLDTKSTAANSLTNKATTAATSASPTTSTVLETKPTTLNPINNNITNVADQLSALKEKLKNDWDTLESQEKQSFETNLKELKKKYQKKLDDAEESEEDNLRLRIKEIKADNLKTVQDIQSGNENLLDKMKRDFLQEERELRLDGERRLADLRKSESEKIDKARADADRDFEAFQDEIKSTYRTRKLQLESQELQKYDIHARELQEKHELQLSALKEKLKQSQEATLASNLGNLSELERIKYNNEEESIRQKYEIQLAECKAREQRKYDSARLEIETSTESKIHELRESARKRISEERAMTDKMVSSAEEDFKQKESIERSRLQMENTRVLEKLRLDLESDLRKAELDLRQNYSLELEALKISSLKEAEENKRKITRDHSKMITALEAEYARKVEDIKSKLYMDEKEEELKVIMDTEQELANRKEKLTAEQREVAQMERDVEYMRQRVTLEKEALVQMERGITSAMAAERSTFRYGSSKPPQIPTSSPVRPNFSDTHSEMLMESDLDALSVAGPTKKSDISDKLRKIDRLVDAAFGTDMDKESDDDSSIRDLEVGSPEARIKKVLEENARDIKRQHRINREKATSKTHETNSNFSEFGEISEITRQLATQTQSLQAQVIAAKAETELIKQRAEDNAKAEKNHNQQPQIVIRTQNHYQKALNTHPSTVQELDCQLSSMLGRARISKENVQKEIVSLIIKPPKSYQSRHTGSTSPAYSSPYFVMHQSMLASGNRDTTSRLFGSPTSHGKHNNTQILFSASQRPRSASASLTGWEEGHSSSEAKLMQRRAWLDKFIIEKDRF